MDSAKVCLFIFSCNTLELAAYGLKKLIVIQMDDERITLNLQTDMIHMHLNYDSNQLHQ